MTAISNNTSREDYLDHGHTKLTETEAHIDKIIDDLIKPSNVIYDVTLIPEKRRPVKSLKRKVRLIKTNKRPILKISLSPPPKFLPQVKKTNTIYAIVRKEGERKEKIYYGKTCNFAKRMYKWNYDINNPDSFNYNCKLARAVRKNPHDFYVKIIETCPIDLLDEREDHYIQTARKAGIPLFNSISGGGGGTARDAYVDPEPSEVPTEFPSPDKLHPIQYVDGKWRPDLSPRTKDMRNVCYAIRHKDKKFGYFGETTGPLNSRMNSHFNVLNNPASSSTSGVGRLKAPMRNAPTEYVVAVYSQFKKANEAGAYEKALITTKREDKDWTVTNVTKGNNGPGPSKRRRVMNKENTPPSKVQRVIFPPLHGALQMTPEPKKAYVDVNVIDRIIR